MRLILVSLLSILAACKPVQVSSDSAVKFAENAQSDGNVAVIFAAPQKGSAHDLKGGPAADAQHLVNILKKLQDSKRMKFTVQPPNLNATRAAMLQGIYEAASTIPADGTLLVYLLGHGSDQGTIADETGVSGISYEEVKTAVSDARQGVTNPALYGSAANMGAKGPFARLVIILTACMSGSWVDLATNSTAGDFGSDIFAQNGALPTCDLAAKAYRSKAGADGCGAAAGGQTTQTALALTDAPVKTPTSTSPATNSQTAIQQAKLQTTIVTLNTLQQMSMTLAAAFGQAFRNGAAQVRAQGAPGAPGQAVAQTYPSPSYPNPSYSNPSYPSPSYPSPSYPNPSYQSPSYPSPSYPSPSYPSPSYPSPNAPGASAGTSTGFRPYGVSVSEGRGNCKVPVAGAEAPGKGEAALPGVVGSILALSSSVSSQLTWVSDKGTPFMDALESKFFNAIDLGPSAGPPPTWCQLMEDVVDQAEGTSDKHVRPSYGAVPKDVLDQSVFGR